MVDLFAVYLGQSIELVVDHLVVYLNQAIEPVACLFAVYRGPRTRCGCTGPSLKPVVDAVYLS